MILVQVCQMFPLLGNAALSVDAMKDVTSLQRLFAAREVLQSLNHHAEVVLRGRPAQPVTDARSAAMAAEEQERHAWQHAGDKRVDGADHDALVELEDLVEREARPLMKLSLDDDTAYLAAATGDDADVGEGGGGKAEPLSDELIRARTIQFIKGIRMVCEDMRIEPSVDGVPVAFPEGTEVTDEDRARARAGAKALAKGGEKTNPNVKPEPGEPSVRAANEEDYTDGKYSVEAGKRRKRNYPPPVTNEEALAVLKDMAVMNRRDAVNAGHGGAGATGWGAAGDLESEACKVDDAVESSLQDDAAMANELLRHFWSAIPLSTPARWDKAARVTKTLEQVYERLEATKRSQTGARRSAVAIRLKPLVQAMDACFQFFDDQKVEKAAAYAAYEKEIASKAAE